MKIQQRSLLLAALAAAVSACTGTAPVAAPGPSAAAPYDVLIRNGLIVDGTGSPWYRGDVALRGDRIAAVGQLRAAQARDTIDATGLVVSPGWIDMLGHSEYPLLRDGRAISKIMQGITSEITGEVTSVVPVNANTLRELGRDSVPWSDLDGYFAALEQARPAINLGTFVTVGSVRRYAMGDANRAPTAAELDTMRAHVAAAMEDGAMGLSSGLIYTPASFATTEEVIELNKVAARYGGGYASHIRSEGDRLVEAVNEAIRIGEEGGNWVQIHHLKASGRANWGKMVPAVAAIEAARARGVDVTADQYPYPASGTGLDATIPNWAHAGGTDSLLARLADPTTRARLREELTGGGTDWRIGTSAGGPSGVMIAGVSTDSLRRYQGMRLSEVAEARGQEVVDALFDILLADRANTSAIYFSMSEEDIEYGMRQPWMMVGIDAGARAADSTVTGKPHPRAYGSFPRILCRYVRERNVITLPDAIRRFTSLPAARVGLDDRGVLKEGMFADLTIFDPNTVCDRATFEVPVQTSVGIVHVIVNGVPVVRGGAVTGERPGRALRRAGAR
ncbi:D-aminoacylase [Longimicrobium sp.]|jgi:dihydroorotase/N-acyl-D-amino-acid deacylase|uniref:N-acyl-D-amino-acid deacylase family protein n=1 Tax=Longimicrobium sp. TaxID=2029185 RepID=UPI002F948743